MAWIPVLTTFLLLLCTLIIVLGQSPCPDQFVYLINRSTNETFGQIQINVPKNISELRMKVVLSIATQFKPSDFRGKMELAQTADDTAQAVYKGRPVLFHVHFPWNKPIPLVTEISANNEVFCTGPIARGQPLSAIELQHVTFFRCPCENNTETPVNNDIDYDCGNITSSTNANDTYVNPLISKGAPISPGQWPWLVAIFIRKREYEYQCAGNILTNRHVLTAAHCFKNEGENTNIPSSTMLASFGRYRLSDWNESGSVNREIESYTLHPDYTHQDSGDSDLAIFTLKDPIDFSPTIKPVCKWSGSPDLGDIINDVGYVVGWGRDEHGNPYLNEPRMARAPIVTHENCHWSDRRLIAFTSKRTFCAGLRDGSGPCNGDSGSGLMIYNAKTHRYYIRGVVSRSLYNRGEDTCDLSQYVVYVDISKYEEWIQQQISTV